MKKTESCVTSSGKTTKDFTLNRGGHQGNRIFAYLLILVMEILST